MDFTSRNAAGATLKQRQLVQHTLPVHEEPRLHVVERIDHHVERAPKGGVEAVLAGRSLCRFRCAALFAHASQVRYHLELAVHPSAGRRCTCSLVLAHVGRAEEELPVEVGALD
eukprot:762051-Pleurochrysis_carterae.AAC.2